LKTLLNVFYVSVFEKFELTKMVMESGDGSCGCLDAPRWVTAASWEEGKVHDTRELLPKISRLDFNVQCMFVCSGWFGTSH